MMEMMGFWLTPLLLLPGVALLLMSTSIRYGQLHDELHRMHDGEVAGIDELIRRAGLFRNALVSLYLSAGLLALGSLAGGLAGFWMASLNWIVQAITCVGVFCIIFGAFELVRESFLSLHVLNEHAKELKK